MKQTRALDGNAIRDPTIFINENQQAKQVVTMKEGAMMRNGLLIGIRTPEGLLLGGLLSILASAKIKSNLLFFGRAKGIYSLK